MLMCVPTVCLKERPWSGGERVELHTDGEGRVESRSALCSPKGFCCVVRGGSTARVPCYVRTVFVATYVTLLVFRGSGAMKRVAST